MFINLDILIFMLPPTIAEEGDWFLALDTYPGVVVRGDTQSTLPV